MQCSKAIGLERLVTCAMNHDIWDRHLIWKGKSILGLFGLISAREEYVDPWAMGINY